MSFFMRFQPFHRQLFIVTYALIIGIMLAFAAYIYQHERGLRIDALNTLLLSQSDELSQRMGIDSLDYKVIENFLQYTPHQDLRITILDLTGNVLYDNATLRFDTLLNHYTRPEIKQLSAQSTAYAIRSSSTMKKRVFYVAKRFPNYLIRAALPYEATLNFLSVKQGFIWIVLLILILATSLLYIFARKLGKSIALLRNFALRAQSLQAVDARELFPENDLFAISKIIVDVYRKLNVANNTLRNEHDKLLEHIQLSNDGIAIFSDKKKELISNKLFIQYANILADSPIVQLEDILKIPEFFKLSSFITEQQKRIITAENLRVQKSSILEKNGTVFRINCIVFQDNSFEIVMRDSTKQEEENRIKRQLTQNIAHELKTPVCSIQGYLETIINTPNLDIDKKHQFINRCYTQTTRLADLLRDISQLNRLDEAAQVFDKKFVNLSQLTERVVHELIGQLDEKKIKVQLNIDSNVEIYGNESLLYSIFRNLIDNSMEYAGNGVHIHISCYRTDENYYYFSYSDTGIGIAEGHLNRIFERFYRVDNGRSRKLGGTGLGLAIVKNAVIYHKGSIVAKNMQAGGLEFLFHLSRLGK
ncbi:MAG: sensor histidine kinase [Bacteroidales bacterium]